MRHLTIIVTLFIFVTLTGCNSGTVVSGTVEYADGSPVTVGNVAFDNGKYCFVGILNKDGSYITGLNGSEKIPAGTYRVYLQGTVEVKETFGGVDGVEILSSQTIDHVPPKYCSPETSGLVLETDGSGKQTFDITVENP